MSREIKKTPSPALVERYLQKSKERDIFRISDEALALLFRGLCPENKKIEHILLKVIALNKLYSTNIFDTYSVARHILKIEDIDARLVVQDYSLVNEIAQISINGKKRIFYSFASKYCGHHQPEHYPIFDSFVEKMLLHFKEADNFDSFDISDLRDYNRFVEIIKSFQGFYKLESYSFREIDIFLWMAGREWFPRR